MALLLGIYSKTSVFDEAVLCRAVSSFSLSGQRPLKEITTHSLKLWLTENTHGFTCCVTENFITALSGRVYNKGGECLECIKGIEDIKLLDGEFTIVQADKKNNSVLIANDYWGMYPLYYIETKEYFAFCNEYEPLAAIFQPCINYTAVAEYFTLGAVLGEKTFLEGISNLPPDATVVLCGGKISITTPTKPNINVNNKICIEDATAHTAYLFKKALQKRITFFNDKIDTMLTGGADTRLILSGLTENQRKSAKFVTYLTPPLTNDEDADVSIASQIADALSLHHEVRTYTLWDKPFNTHYFQYKRNIAAEKYLSGHFGSELFKKELYKAVDKRLLFLLTNDNNLIKKYRKSNDIKKSLRSIFSDELLKSIPSPYETFKREREKCMFCENDKLLFLLNISTRSFFTSTWGGTSSIYFDQPAYMPVIFIMPFLDRELISFMLTLPEDFFGMGHDNLYNLLFKNNFQELTHFETNSPLGNDPFSILKGNSTFNNGYDFRRHNYEVVFEKLLKDKNMLKNYHNHFIDSISQADKLVYKQSFIDYEVWRKYISF